MLIYQTSGAFWSPLVANFTRNLVKFFGESSNLTSLGDAWPVVWLHGFLLIKTCGRQTPQLHVGNWDHHVLCRRIPFQILTCQIEMFLHILKIGNSPCISNPMFDTMWHQTYGTVSQEQAMRKMSECTAFDLSILVWSFDVPWPAQSVVVRLQSMTFWRSLALCSNRVVWLDVQKIRWGLWKSLENMGKWWVMWVRCWWWLWWSLVVSQRWMVIGSGRPLVLLFPSEVLSLELRGGHRSISDWGDGIISSLYVNIMLCYYHFLQARRLHGQSPVPLHQGWDSNREGLNMKIWWNIGYLTWMICNKVIYIYILVTNGNSRQ